jgi:AAHS family 4-hydroxybenzoate transporter-like MFS transporter
VAAKINLAAVLENSRIGPLQIRVFTLCMICLVMDGFDVQAMGYAAPYVSKEWSPIISAGGRSSSVPPSSSPQ